MFCNKCGNEIKEHAKFCNKCGSQVHGKIPFDGTRCNYEKGITHNTDKINKTTIYDETKETSKMSWFRAFARVLGRKVSTTVGKAVVYVIIFALMFGIVVLSLQIPAVGLIVALIGAVMGWRLITFIQPAMFVWMPLMGWVIYFIIKFFISAIIGTFILVPINLSQRFINFCVESCDEYKEEI